MMQLLYQVILGLLSIIGKVSAEKITDRLFNRSKIYIDRVLYSENNISKIFDISLSSTFNTPISITKFKVRFSNKKKKLAYINGLQEIAAQYKITSQDDNTYTLEVENEKHTNLAHSSINKRRGILECNLLHSLEANTISRFTIQWMSIDSLEQFQSINTIISYRYKGKEQEATFESPNQYFNQKEIVLKKSL